MEKTANENDIKAAVIAGNILELSRNSLVVCFRYLDRTIARLKFVQDDNFTLETDGESLFYNSWYVLAQYRDEPSALTRNILHSYLHCVFCHSFIGKDIDRIRWDLACDIAVENAVSSMKGECVRSSRERKQKEVTDALKAEIGEITAEKVYRYLRKSDITDEEAAAQRALFKGDGHGLWYGDKDPDSKADRNIKLKKIWEEVSKRMQVELDTTYREEDVLIQNLRSILRSRRSYTEFLKKFSVYGEVMRMSDDEFDNNYYTYGLSTYGNMPLVEMLEYSEQKRLREFAIAIDTSGSVKGEIVQNFIQHTYIILTSGENFFNRIKVLIIQCDCMIREEIMISSREEFEKYIQNLEIKGLESTDFRPVFQLLDSKIANREFSDFRGLIYFTDGLGTFPGKVPKYETAFIIHRSDYSEPEIPQWAMSMTIQEDEIIDKKFSS